MGAESVSLEETEKWLGRETSFEGVDEVTRSDIRRKLEVFCFDCPLHYDEDVARAHGYRTIIAPAAITPLWAMPAYWAPGQPSIFAPGLPEKNGTVRADIPGPFSKGFNASSEVENLEPLYPGDRLRGTAKLVEITPKRTRLGEGVFLTTETRLWKVTGELVAVQRHTGYRYNPLPERLEEVQASPREQEPAPDQTLEGGNPEIDWSQQRLFQEVVIGDDLPPYSIWLNYQRIVMSVAVDRMWSSIHHNRDAARAAGLDDIIFNTRGYEMVFEIALRRWMGLAGWLRKLGPFRMVKNSIPGDTLTCRARVTNKEIRDGRGLVHLEISVQNPRAEAARGQAVVSLPMRG
ncbi:MAG TPA: MaoC family dehydratase N-terminal domain-containing protein [Chloroflexota bacterium]|nr:MaoC family dehydratase N-terminal domain-containing protein [Chloroflexota bacterium]